MGKSLKFKSEDSIEDEEKFCTQNGLNIEALKI